MALKNITVLRLLIEADGRSGARFAVLLGVSPSMWSMLLGGRRRVSRDQAKVLAKALGCNLSAIWEGR